MVAATDLNHDLNHDLSVRYAGIQIVPLRETTAVNPETSLHVFDPHLYECDTNST